MSKERKLELKREPDNKYDKNAIAVMGHCLHEGSSFSAQLGYVPADIAKLLKNIDPLEATIKVMYYPTERSFIDIRMDIWTKRAEAKKPIEQAYKKIKIPKDSVDKNLLGMQLEKEGYLDNAIELYEKVIEGNFGGNLPYDRLAIIYHRKKQYQDEVRVLNE